MYSCSTEKKVPTSTSGLGSLPPIDSGPSRLKKSFENKELDEILYQQPVGQFFIDDAKST
jgi:hypothetical protein